MAEPATPPTPVVQLARVVRKSPETARPETKQSIVLELVDAGVRIAIEPDASTLAMVLDVVHACVRRAPVIPDGVEIFMALQAVDLRLRSSRRPSRRELRVGRAQRRRLCGTWSGSDDGETAISTLVEQTFHAGATVFLRQLFAQQNVLGTPAGVVCIERRKGAFGEAESSYVHALAWQLTVVAERFDNALRQRELDDEMRLVERRPAIVEYENNRGGNLPATARELGVSRSLVYRVVRETKPRRY